MCSTLQYQSWEYQAFWTIWASTNCTRCCGAHLRTPPPEISFFLNPRKPRSCDKILFELSHHQHFKISSGMKIYFWINRVWIVSILGWNCNSEIIWTTFSKSKNLPRQWSAFRTIYAMQMKHTIPRSMQFFFLGFVWSISKNYAKCLPDSHSSIVDASSEYWTKHETHTHKLSQRTPTHLTHSLVNSFSLFGALFVTFFRFRV